MDNQPASDFNFSAFQSMYMNYLSTCTVPPEFTDADQMALDAYNSEVDRLTLKEPPMGEGGSVSSEWAAWNDKKWKLICQYSTVICKAMAVNALYMLRLNGDVTKAGSPLIKLPEIKGVSDLLDKNYFMLLNGTPTNTLAKVGPRRMQKDNLSGKATFEQGGQKITVENFDQVISQLNTSAKKLLDIGIAYLTDGNFYRGGNVVPTAVIPLMDYWRAQGIQVDPRDDSPEEAARLENYIKSLKTSLRQNLRTLSSIVWEGNIVSRVHNGHASYRFVSGWAFLRGNKLKINFDIDLANYLIYAYQMQFPTVLLRHDNRNPNAYTIGRKIALHHSMDSNAASGTLSTLSVRSLLEAAPDIPSYESLIEDKRRDWKKRIKGVLESALNENIRVGYLLRWEYRDPHANSVATYDAKTASKLIWEQYSELVVDFVVRDEPDQAVRRATRSEEQAQAAAELPAKKKQTKKRGRPSAKSAKKDQK